MNAGSWPTEALKAQAVAARTYAYRQDGTDSRGYNGLSGLRGIQLVSKRHRSR